MLTYKPNSQQAPMLEIAMRGLRDRLRGQYAGMSAVSRSRARNIARGYIKLIASVCDLHRSLAITEDTLAAPRAFFARIMMQEFVARKRPMSESDMSALLDDCESDLVAWRSFAAKLLRAEVERVATSQSSP